jgi:glycosyltransferase involved in cell wall biosynthesis
VDDIRVSIIVPVYNVEEYIIQCLDSVVNQTLKEIEIICVNDGSTDGSLQILEAYAEKDERIKIINEKNRGQGAARNTGMKLANGEYVGFVDSDDWIELDTYEKLYNNAVSNNSDIVLFEIKIYTGKEGFDYYGGYDIKEDDDIDFNHFTFNFKDKSSPLVKPVLVNRTVSACLKLYKTEFLKGNDDLVFAENTYFEEVVFHILTLLRANRISYCNDRLYIYRKSNDNSICNVSLRSDKLWDIFPVMEEAENVLIENNVMDVFRYEFIAFTILQFSRRLDTCSDSIKNEFLDDIKKYFESLEWGKDIINKLHPSIQIVYKNITNSETYNEIELLRENLYLKKSINSKDNLIKKQNNEIKKRDKIIQIKNAEKTKIMNSNSWKMTEPLRKIGSWLRR